jgi:hypothetical protein
MGEVQTFTHLDRSISCLGDGATSYSHYLAFEVQEAAVSLPETSLFILLSSDFSYYETGNPSVSSGQGSHCAYLERLLTIMLPSQSVPQSRPQDRRVPHQWNSAVVGGIEP